MDRFSENNIIRKGDIRLEEGNIQVYNINLSPIIEKALIENGYDIDIKANRLSDIDRGTVSIQVYRKIER